MRDQYTREVEATFNQTHLLDKLTATVPCILYIYDLIERRNVYVGGRLLEVLGYTVAQIQSSQDLIATLIHPDDTEAVLKHYKRFESAKDDEVRSIEYRVRHAGGEWRWLCCFE